MEFIPLTETPLQIELNRIEAEAARHSAMICAAAQQWETAHLLCQRLNALADLNPGSLFSEPLVPHATYHPSDDAAEICIYTHERGLAVLQLARDTLPLVSGGEAYANTDQFECPDYPGVMIYIRTQYVETFQQQHAEAA